MYLRRHCFDKWRRCPGWAGGGPKFPRTDRCRNGYLTIDDTDRWRHWRFHRCTRCDVLVLPDVMKWVSPTWWVWIINRWRQNRRRY